MYGPPGAGQPQAQAAPKDGVADLPKFDFASGKSTHFDRLNTIREVWEEYGVMIDTHTADGLKVGLEQRRPSLPLVCLETALPAKFAETIQEALEQTNEIIVTLRAALDDMEEVLETVELAERQKIDDEREIESLQRALRQLHHSPSNHPRQHR